MQQVGLMHLWSDGGAQTTPYIMQAGYTPTETAPNKRDPGVAEQEKQSIQEYAKNTSMK